MTDTEQAAAGTEAFSRRFLAHAASQLPNRTASQLRELARETFEFGRTRAPGRTLIRTSRTDADSATLDVITDDARFLVESVLVELERSGGDVEHVLHPQIVVRRDADGVIEHVFDIDDSAEVPAGAEVESWTHIEFGDIAGADLPALVERLHEVLDDVHAAMADTSRMYQLMRTLADQLADNPGDFDREASEEAAHLLRWLADGNYLITGHACYAANDLASGSATGERTTGTNDGVLRNSSRISPMELLPAFRSGAPIVIFKSPLVSRIRRSVRYDCVTVVTPAAGSEPQKVHVFLGLLTSAEDGNVARVPGVRRRISEILLRSGARADSHTGRLLMAALRTLPRDELLEAPTGDLLRLAQLVVDRGERRTVGVFARVHLNRDFVGVLVYFPADRFGPEVRRRVVDLINEYWPGEVIGRDDRIVEMNLARMQILIQLRPGTQPPKVDRAEVEAKVAKVTRRWSDDLSDLLTLSVGEQEATRLTRRYRGALPEAYKEDFDASTAAADLVRLEELPPENGLAFTLYTPESPDEGDRRLKVYRTGRSVSLARALPIFTHMGIEVLDERPYEIDLNDGHAVWIYDFGLRLPAGVDLDGPAAATMVDALGRLWREELERDGFNRLVVGADMTWWQANVLRAYAKYLRQTGATYSQGYIEETLAENPRIARALVELFEARFDPARAGEPTSAITDDIDAALADVASLDHDRILRALLTLVSATVRTNAYRTDTIGDTGPAPDSSVEANRRTALAFKLDPRLIPDLPQPRPRHEVWVYSPRVEGVHLRFGAVARGGLRWSDRREDFRTEVLGLVKAQMVKNAVIVPVGAKGGFVAKAAPDPSADRDAWLAEGISAYRTFISSLLDITDNLQIEGGEQKIVPPPQVRRYDGDDTYLVVAADKGTATFSDIANGIAVDYGFWLGDAFASGGSAGYDHKAMGITARGAWESVKYHFRELGINTQEQDFTVVGVGDMSGDVFGNGMLLSEHIRLVAAFDHRHIFLDPDPDAATSYAERRRLFDLPRSSWADYDLTLISEGGGVYPRTVKSIPISAPVRAALGLADDTVKLTPSELMHAILLAPVDLLWNGGIGTYVKASDEPQSAAGDKANDAIRVDGAQLRCRVVGEGGNLGLTQLGRVEFALNGGRINTDAIDNSAGVDTSDHEVNIKILLDRAVATGELSPEQRNEMLAAATDEVAHLVLRDNYLQNVMLGMARSTAPALVSVHRRMISALEKSGDLDRAIEFLPPDRVLAAREDAGQGLTSPELAVLAAYAKITLTRDIDDSTLPDEGWFEQVLSGYFPRAIGSRFSGTLLGHPLHREITGTAVVNDMINHGGISYVHRAIEETGAKPSDVARAYVVVREVFGLGPLWDELESLDNVAETSAQHTAYHEIRRLIDRATRWFLDVRFPIGDLALEIERYQATVQGLGSQCVELLQGAERQTLLQDAGKLSEQGLPADLALRLVELLTAFLLLDVVEISQATGEPAESVARVHFELSERLSIDNMLTKITALPRDDRWLTLARAAVRHEAYDTLAAITTSVVTSTDADLPAGQRIGQWLAANPERVERAVSTVGEALARDHVDLATLSVALRSLRSVAS